MGADFTGHPRGRTAQLPTPARRSRRECRSPSGDPRLPRSGPGRTVEVWSTVSVVVHSSYVLCGMLWVYTHTSGKYSRASER